MVTVFQHATHSPNRKKEKFILYLVDPHTSCQGGQTEARGTQMEELEAQPSVTFTYNNDPYTVPIEGGRVNL